MSSHFTSGPLTATAGYVWGFICSFVCFQNIEQPVSEELHCVGWDTCLPCSLCAFQLCVNMINQRLRLYASEVLFQQEQAECLQEGITMEIPVSGNSHVAVLDFFLQVVFSSGFDQSAPVWSLFTWRKTSKLEVTCSNPMFHNHRKWHLPVRFQKCNTFFFFYMVIIFGKTYKNKLPYNSHTPG